MIHVVLIATGKVIIDAIPGVTRNISWTAVNLTYLAVRPYHLTSKRRLTPMQCSYLMFHWVTGIPFGSELHGGAYDDLTLWEQIDGGAQNTPSRKWLFSVPVGLCVFHPMTPFSVLFRVATHAKHKLKQLPALNALHQLQPVAFRD